MVLVRAVAFTGNVAVAVFDAVALLVTVPFMFFYAVTVVVLHPGWTTLAVLLPAAYFVLLGALIRRTPRGWNSHRHEVMKKLIWDVALLHAIALPMVIAGSII